MKRILFIIVAVLVTSVVSAQTAKKSEPKAESREEKVMTECVMNKEGKVLHLKDGKTTELKQEVTLEDGTKVLEDGTYVSKDGKKNKLKAGECIGQDGKVCKEKDCKMMKESGHNSGKSGKASEPKN